MPRNNLSRPKSPRGSSNPAVFRDTPRLLSPEEKRELILAHAAASAKGGLDPVQRLSLWAGIAVAVAVLATGWWLTVGWQIRGAVSHGKSEVRKMTERMNEMSEQLTGSQALRGMAPSPTSQVEAAELGKRIKSALESAASSSDRGSDLLSPRAPSSSEPATAPASYPVDPASPGLTPD